MTNDYYRLYYKINKEKYKIQNNMYYQLHKDERQQYAIENREKIAEYYKIYNKYRRAKKLEKMDEFIDKHPKEYNMLITSGRVWALKAAALVEIVGSHSEKMEE